MPRWTEQTKQQQRELILHQRPWLQATGPLTPYGCSVSSKNATGKHRRRQPEPPAPTPMSSDVIFVSHLNQRSDNDKPREIGARVIYVTTASAIKPFAVAVSQFVSICLIASVQGVMRHLGHVFFALPSCPILDHLEPRSAKSYAFQACLYQGVVGLAALEERDKLSPK